MAMNIATLATSNDCNIVVDDMSHPDEPPFQEAFVSDTIGAVAAQKGVLFISSAGNFGNAKYGRPHTWEGDFVDGGTDPKFGSGHMHRFSANATFATVTSPHDPNHPNTLLAVFWSDPWLQLHRTANYELYVFSPTDELLGSAMNNRLPYEAVYLLLNVYINKRWYLDSGDKIYIVKADGSPARFLHLDMQYATIDAGTGGSSRGHNAASSVISVAAVDAPVPPAPFVGGPATTVWPRSSDGRRRIFFEPNGNAITPDNFLAATGVDKPDLAAATCSDIIPAALGTFCGTSAAAPYVAGIAALIWSYKPTLTAAQVREILIASALDIETPGLGYALGLRHPHG
jgi:subtilisin family serine protease